MPTHASSFIPPPRSWEEFEDIVLSAAKLRWGTANFYRHGRPYQRQHGVDIWGTDTAGQHIGIQCKNAIGGVTSALVSAELEKSDKFSPLLDQFFVATTSPRDAKLQEQMRKLSEVRRQNGQSTVAILFWPDLIQDLVRDSTIFAMHYPLLIGLGDPLGTPEGEETYGYTIARAHKDVRVTSRLGLHTKTELTLRSIVPALEGVDIRYEWGGDGSVELDVEQPRNCVVLDHPIPASLWSRKKLLFPEPLPNEHEMTVIYSISAKAVFKPDAPYISWSLDRRYSMPCELHFTVVFEEAAKAAYVWFQEQATDMRKPSWTSDPLAVQPGRRYAYPRAIVPGSRVSICWNYE